MKKPNFFILGAPKCGTTALSDWLRQHPQTYMAPGKETRFFDTDHQWYTRISLAEYEELFRGASEQHIAVGEATPTYLKSTAAVPNILDYSPDAKFIACVRNPVEMSFSLHNQLIYNGEEDILDFETAWRAQAEGRIPRRVRSPEPSRLQYGAWCKLGAQIDRLYSYVSREKVLIVFMSDMRECPDSVYRKVIAFLGLDYHPVRFEVSNTSAQRRSMMVRQMSRRLGRLKTSLGVRKGFGVLRVVDGWNRKPAKWTARPDMVEELTAYFAEDISLLSQLTGRSLDEWLMGGTSIAGARPGSGEMQA